MGIQPRIIALAANSLPMEGRAMLIEDPTKGVRNEVNTATMRAYFLGDIGMITYGKVISSLEHNYIMSILLR